MKNRWLKITLAVAAVLLATSGTAQAKPRHAGKFEVQRANAFGAVSLGRRNGFRVDLFMGSQGIAILTMDQVRRTGGETGTFSLAQYVVHMRGSLAQGVARGRFGSLGTFSLRFRPNGQVRDRGVPRGCEGPPTITEYGRFVGHIAFHGEGNYLDVSLPGGKGEITRSFELICERGQAYHQPSKPLRWYAAPSSFATAGDIALLYASARRHGRFIGVAAGHQAGAPPGAELRFEMFESRGAMAIGRFAFAEASPGTLLTSLPGQHPATATLAPPPPFYGEADYREKSEHSGTWSGNLGIDFAGLKLPLTGPGFHARLCVLNPLRHRKGCDFLKGEPEYGERRARPWWMAR